MSINFPNPELPALRELMERPQWVAWRYKKVIDKDGNEKETKPPVNPRIGGGASHSDPNTWGTYAQARVFALSRKLAGIGFVLTDDDGYTGIDLDKVRDKETGEIEPWAAEIVALAETYTEISPSGTGLRLIARGKVEATVKCDPAHVEIYKSQRYLTITGDHVPGTPTSIEPAPRTLAALLTRVEEIRPKAEPIQPQAAPTEPAKAERAPLNFFGGKERASRARKERPAAKGDFWKNLRDATMNDVSWFADLFPAAKFQPGTGGWRVASKYLGRNLEEDISITPGAATGGIVDFGVADMGDKKLGKRTAVDLVMEWGGAETPEAAARWLCDRIGLTMESLGWTERAAAMAPDPEPPQAVEIQPDGTVIDAETGEVLVQPAAPEEPPPPNDGVGEDLPDHLTRMPGILGDLVDFLFDTSATPSRTVALVTALAITGTVAGRYWATPREGGTHFYWAILGKTGVGKQHVADMGKIVLRAIGMSDLIGPDDFTAQGAVFAHVVRNPLSLCFFDELGDMLARGRNRRASTHESGVSSVLKKLWGINYGEISTQQYVQRASETIFAPALSIVGVTAPEQFWGALEGADISGGFLNRFLVFPIFSERKTIIPKIAGNAKRDVPSQIVRWLQAIHCGGNKIVAESKARQSSEPVNAQIIPWASDGVASDLYLKYASVAVSRFDGTDKEHLANFYARAAENALRLATLHALATSPRAPRVTAEGMRWAIDVVEWSCQCATRSADLYMSETDFQANAQLIKRALFAAPGKMMSRSDLIVRLNHKIRRRELDDILALMVEGKQVVEMKEQKSPGKRGAPATLYRYVESAPVAPITEAAI